MATPKQRKAVERLSENIGKDTPKPIGEILKEVGYSKSVSETPALVLKSKGFIECLEEAGVTDDKLSRVLEEGLEAHRDGKPDFSVRHKYLETAVKLKGHLVGAPDSNTGTTYNTFIQQNNLNPNAPDSRKLVDASLDFLMEQMKEK